jgi:hypothetical protein
MSKIKLLGSEEFIELGKIHALPRKSLCAIWSDVMYFSFSDPDLGLVAYFPKSGVIEVFPTFDPPSTATEDDVVLSMKYDSLPLFMSFEELSSLSDKEILALIEKNRLTFKEYEDLTLYFV